MPELAHHALKERTESAALRHASTSAHVLDLTPFAAPVVQEKKSAPRGFARLRHMLDERIHLHDLRVRRVSTHHVDWRDFPPHHAKGLRHAARITLHRFLDEHPLADLTIVTVAHIAVLIAWRIVSAPHRALTRTRVAMQSVAAPLLLPAVRVMPREHAHTAPQKRFVLRMPRIRFSLPHIAMTRTASIAAAAALFILPMGAYAMLGGLRSQKALVVDDGMRAVGMLKAAVAAAQAHDFSASSEALHAAAGDFAEARQRLGALGIVMNAASEVLPINSAATSASPLLTAGEEAAAGGAELTAGLTAAGSLDSPLAKLRAIRDAATRALPHLNRASDAVQRVSEGIIPQEHREKFELARRELPRLAGALAGASEASLALEAVLGGNGERRYLVLFQNNAELRPTGGFIGSFALVDVKDGKIAAMEIPGGGSYDLQGSLGLDLVAPQPLRLINPRWEFQDANWYPDFPSSAAQISRFYEKSGGPTVDGVIAVNASLMESLLAATGPIDMPAYGKTISAQNFFYETQKQVEVEYDKTANKPKQFVADLAPKMLERIMTGDEKLWFTLAGTVATALAEKDLQIWFRDADLQTRLAGYCWDGSMGAADGDYLAIVHTNIAGQKTDRAMKETVTHTARIMADGSAVVTLEIARTHTGQKGALFSGVRNVDYLRVYVPEGSTLVEARGFNAPDAKLFGLAEAGADTDPALAEQERGMRIDRESGTQVFTEQGKTVFGNWVQTDPGETSTVSLTYKLPAATLRIADERGIGALYARVTGGSGERLMRYGLTVRKQAGEVPPQFTSVIEIPRGAVVATESPTRALDDRGRSTVTQELRTDTAFDMTITLP